MGAPHWLILFAAILASWVVLFAMAVPADLRVAGAIWGQDLFEALCVASPDMAGLLRVSAMWMIMSAAMMLPTALPALATYDDLSHSTAQTSPFLLIAGYLAVWAGFSVLAAAVQLALVAADLVSPFGDSRSTVLSAALLALAGIYQFSPVKDACLSKCRQPLTFFITYWDEGPWRNGLRLGAVCLGCCWALMLLAFVGGVMNLAFMGLATLIMVFEKLPRLGAPLTRPLGAILLLGALGLLVTV